MRRVETARAKSKGETVRTLSEADYLLGVNDEARQGALRFSLEDGGPYLTPKDKKSIPPLIDLPRLLSVTERYLDDDETVEDLKILLAPGSSLGGARPKASIRDKDSHLAIAKFPKKDDEFNVVLWEAVALTVAEKAGITTTKWRLSPAYDINPTPVEIKARLLSTSINFDDPTASIDLALSVINEFRIKKVRAQEIIREVAVAVSQWRSIAQKFGLSKREVDRMASAFEHEDLEKAKKI